MEVKQQFARRSRVTIGLTIFLVVVALLLGWSLIHSGRGPADPSNEPGSRAWFSTDDGKTWFADSASRLPPFDHEGKPACRVYLFLCDGGGTKFVAYMQRYTAQAKTAMEQALRQNGSALEEPDLSALNAGTLEVKKPGTSEWINVRRPEAAVIQKPVCPDGSRKNIAPVLP